MTLDEYKQKIKEIDIESESKKADLAKQYALANNYVSIGDILIDHYQKIRVVTIRVNHNWRNPQCIYSGPLLTKQGREFKSGRKGYIFQGNIKEHIINIVLSTN
jgi:hypothetical protein